MSVKDLPYTIEAIIKSDLCVSCGACVHICPHRNISMKYDESLTKWRADISDPRFCASCNGRNNCLSVCPSAGIDYMNLSNSHENHLLGRIKNIYNGYSKDSLRRFHSSSGGFIKDLCHSLLNRGEINGIISITHKIGLDYYPEILTDVSKMPNSVYHNINYENAVNLLKDAIGKFLVIGLPCHITSIKLLANKKKMQFLNDKIKLTLALICGYTFDRCNAHAFACYNQFDMEKISYREEGRFRKTRISNETTSMVFPVLFSKNMVEHLNNTILFDPFLCQKACLYCVDHIGYCADLVVGDAWQHRYSRDQIGTNLIISRTETGEDTLKKVDGFNFKTGCKDEIIEAQSNNYAKGALGEGIRKYFQNELFIPSNKRTDNLDDLIVYHLQMRDIIKIRIVKFLLRRKHYFAARILYAIIFLLDQVTSVISRRVK